MSVTLYYIRNPTDFILNITVCPASVPSEGSVWTITFVLKTTTSYLDSACFVGG